MAKIVAQSFKNLPDRLSKPAALFSSMFLRIFSTLSSERKVNLNLVFFIFLFEPSKFEPSVDQIGVSSELL